MIMAELPCFGGWIQNPTAFALPSVLKAIVVFNEGIYVKPIRFATHVGYFTFGEWSELDFHVQRGAWLYRYSGPIGLTISQVELIQQRMGTHGRKGMIEDFPSRDPSCIRDSNRKKYAGIRDKGRLVRRSWIQPSPIGLFGDIGLMAGIGVLKSPKEGAHPAYGYDEVSYSGFPSWGRFLVAFFLAAAACSFCGMWQAVERQRLLLGCALLIATFPLAHASLVFLNFGDWLYERAAILCGFYLHANEYSCAKHIKQPRLR